MFGKTAQNTQLIEMQHYTNQRLTEIEGDLNSMRVDIDEILKACYLLLQYAHQISTTQPTKTKAKLDAVKTEKSKKSPKASKDITKTLKAVRKALGMRQVDVAKGVGVSTSTIKDIEKGYRKPTEAQVKKLEQVLGVEL